MQQFASSATFDLLHMIVMIKDYLPDIGGGELTGVEGLDV